MSVNILEHFLSVPAPGVYVKVIDQIIPKVKTIVEDLLVIYRCFLICLPTLFARTASNDVNIIANY